jgi:type IV secretory pathway VirB10-like protein
MLIIASVGVGVITPIAAIESIATSESSAAETPEAPTEPAPETTKSTAAETSKSTAAKAAKPTAAEASSAEAAAMEPATATVKSAATAAPGQRFVVGHHQDSGKQRDGSNRRCLPHVTLSYCGGERRQGFC